MNFLSLEQHRVKEATVNWKWHFLRSLQFSMGGGYQPCSPQASCGVAWFSPGFSANCLWPPQAWGRPATCYNQNRLLKPPAINPVISSRETEGHFNPLEHKGLQNTSPWGGGGHTGGSAAWWPGVWLAFMNSDRIELQSGHLVGGCTFPLCDVTCNLMEWSCCLGLSNVVMLGSSERAPCPTWGREKCMGGNERYVHH